MATFLKLANSKRDLVDSAYLVLLQGINQFLPLVIMPYLLFVLQPEGYGHVGFAFSFVQYFTLIVDFGFNLSATKRISQSKDNIAERSRIFWATFLAKTILLLFSTILLASFVFFSPTCSFYSHSIWATWPMLLGTAFTSMWFFQGMGIVRLFSILNTVSKVVFLPLIFFLVKTPSDYVMAAFLQSIVFVSTAVVSNAYLAKRHLVNWVGVKMADVKREVGISFPLFLSTASTSVYTQLFIVVVGFYCSNEVVGLYSAADRIVRALVFFLYVPLMQVFFPSISALANNQRNQAVAKFVQLRSLVFVVMLLLCLSIFFGAPLIPMVLGQNYEGAVDFMRMLCILPLLIGIGGVYGQCGLVALGSDKSVKAFRNVYIVVAILSVLIVLLVAPIAGAVGVCLMAVFSEALVAILMFYQFKRNRVIC